MNRPCNTRNSLTSALALLAALVSPPANSLEPPTDGQLTLEPRSAPQAYAAYPWEHVLGDEPTTVPLPATSVPESEALAACRTFDFVGEVYPPG
jgi:hypothetical protein